MLLIPGCFILIHFVKFSQFVTIFWANKPFILTSSHKGFADFAKRDLIKFETNSVTSLVDLFWDFVWYFNCRQLLLWHMQDIVSYFNSFGCFIGHSSSRQQITSSRLFIWQRISIRWRGNLDKCCCTESTSTDCWW